MEPYGTSPPVGQPVAATTVGEADRLLCDVEVARIYGIHRSTLWKRLKSGLVPVPVQHGRSVRWLHSEVQAHLRALGQARTTTKLNQGHSAN